MGEGLYTHHLQEATRRRWGKTLSLGGLCLATISYFIWDKQSAETTKDTVPSREALQSDGKRSPPMDCSGMLDWANGLLSAGGLCEEPGGIKVTESQALGLRVRLFELRLFKLGLLVLSFCPGLRSASYPGSSLSLSFLPWLQPALWLFCSRWPLLSLPLTGCLAGHRLTSEPCV